MRLSKTNIIRNARVNASSVQKTVAASKEQITQNPAALLVIAAAVLALTIPAVGTAVTSTEVVDETSTTDITENVEESGFEEHGEAAVVIDGETYTSEDGEIDVTVEGASDVQIDGANSESVSTIVNITSSSSSDENGGDDEQTILVNGEEVEQSRTGRFDEEIEDENSETEIKGRIEGNATINIEVN